MQRKHLTEAEAIAFRHTYPHYDKWLSTSGPGLRAGGNVDHDDVISRHKTHVADSHRMRKKFIGELRSLTETAQKENRDLTELEKTLFSCFEKLIQNQDLNIEETEEFLSSGVSYTPPSASGTQNRADPKKVIFRANESIAEHRPPAEETRSLSLGRILKVMALGGASEAEQRALSEGTNSAGGFTVPSPLLASFIDLMRKKMVCQRAGAQTILLDSNKVSIARLATDPSAGWRLELGGVATSDPTFEQVNFTARSLAVLVRLSLELIEDSLNVETILMNALAQSLALEVDRICLFGTGTAPEPKGITLVSGIQSVAVGAANGGQLTNYTPIISAMQKLAEANAEPPTALVMAPRTRFGLAGLLDTTNQPLNAPAIVAAVPQLHTTAVPVNMTKGTATNATKIILGDFSQMLLGVRQELRIETLKERFSDTLEVGFLAHLRLDVQFAHPESFAVIDGIIP